MNLVLAKSQGPQGVRILLRFGGKALGLPARTESIGELGDGENAFAVLLLRASDTVLIFCF